MIIKLHPKAEEDLNQALNYYNEIDKSLEKKFINSLDETFSRILKFPNIYPYETNTSQKTLMNKSSYIIIYEKYEDMIMILAIFHTSREPLNLDDRIS